MISVDPNIALHMNIQKVIPVLKTVFSVSFHGSTLQQVHRDFKLIGKVSVFKPFANDYCNTNSEDAEWEAQQNLFFFFFFNSTYNRIFLSSVSSQTSKQQAGSRLQFCFFFFNIKWSGLPTRFFPTSTHYTKSFLMFPIRAALQANHV